MTSTKNQFDKKAFFAAYRAAFGGIKKKQVAPLEFLLDMLIAKPPSSLPAAAYMLATTKHETNDTYLPVQEAYWLSDSWRHRNLRYAPYWGRGFVQLTWEYNYKRAGDKLGFNLVDNPARAMDPEISYDIMLQGMEAGWFTGKKNSDYLSGRKPRYTRARRIINGTDKAKLVAKYAVGFEKALKVAGYTVKGYS